MTRDGRAVTEKCKGFESTGPAIEAGPSCRRTWREELKDRVVQRGIQAMCGASSDIPTAVAADIPLVSAGLRFSWLRILEGIGVGSVIGKSGLGHRFVCHIGDIAEFPYYHRRALAPELALCAAWLRDKSNPVIYDVGANVGFFSTQLSQMLAARSPQIYAFEPVPTTFAKLVHSVQQLNLRSCIHPVAAAVLEDLKTVSIAYSDLNSLFSQVSQPGHNSRVGQRTAHVLSVSLDAFCSLSGQPPVLVKIDVEGSEVAVLRGAQQMLSRAEPPAIVIEISPMMLAECSESVGGLEKLLSGYSFHYIDDIVGQKLPYGSPVTSLDELQWTCNLLAIPKMEGFSSRCSSAFDDARRILQIFT